MMKFFPVSRISQKTPAIFFILFFAGPLLKSVPVQAAVQTPPGHVVIFVLENKGYREIIGNPDAPFINRLATHNILLTDYHALAHPSLPNYVAMLSGRTDGVHSDNPKLRFSDPTIAEFLVRKGYSVKGYFQSLPERGYLGSGFPPGKPLYVIRHNPFYLFGQIRSDAGWKSRVVPIGDLEEDLGRGQLPALSFVIGDLCHDMHGGRRVPTGEQKGFGPCRRPFRGGVGGEDPPFSELEKRSDSDRRDLGRRTISGLATGSGRVQTAAACPGLGRKGSFHRGFFPGWSPAKGWGVFRPPESCSVHGPFFFRSILPCRRPSILFRKKFSENNNRSRVGSGVFVEFRREIEQIDPRGQNQKAADGDRLKSLVPKVGVGVDVIPDESEIDRTSGGDDPSQKKKNTEETKSFFHGSTGCRRRPPLKGVFVECDGARMCSMITFKNWFHQTGFQVFLL